MLKAKTMKTSFLGVLFTVILAVSAPLTAHALEKICANYVSPLPAIDGDLDTVDGGWVYANNLTFNNGITQPYARLRMGRDYSNLYLSVRVQLDPTFNPEDVIILMFGPATNGAGTFQKIAVFPVDVAGGPTTASSGLSNVPKDLSYWDSTSGGSSISWASRTVPNWLANANGNVRVMSSTTSATDKWYQIEMRLPISTTSSNGLVVPTSGDFRMYVNTIRYQPDPMNPGSFISPEVSWPQSAPLTTGDLNNTPAPVHWGLASIAGPCSGVHVTRAVTNTPSMTSVSVNSTNNIFTIDIQNSGADAAGNVRAELQNARFGLPGPGLFAAVPWPGNPMTTTGGINAGQTVTISTGAWDLLNAPAAQRDEYLNNTSLCSRVVLTPASGTNTLISNPVYGANMHFGTTSKFEHKAFLDATGYPRRRDGRPGQQFVLNVFTANDLPLPLAATRVAGDIKANQTAMMQTAASLREDARALSASAFIEKGAKFYRKFVCGYRRTGEFITIKGTKAEVVAPANCYGYLLAHLGDIHEWVDSLKGDGLRPMPVQVKVGEKPLYEAHYAELGEGQSLALSTTIETVDLPKPGGGGGGGCASFSSFAKNGADRGAATLAGSLLMVGGLGVGGLAFLRRRKPEPAEAEKKEPQS